MGARTGYRYSPGHHTNPKRVQTDRSIPGAVADGHQSIRLSERSEEPGKAATMSHPGLFRQAGISAKVKHHFSVLMSSRGQ